MLARLQEQVPDLALPPRCQITWIHYAGDEGGIVCKLDFGTEDDRAVFVVSITYLTFDRRLPWRGRSRPTRNTVSSACVAAARRRRRGRTTEGRWPSERDQSGLVNMARKSSSARFKPSSVNTTDLALLTGSPIIRTPAEGVGRDSRRLGLRID